MSGDRAAVTTRVSPEQKDHWREDAQRLGMSQSEFVRTMVQAGRRELGLSGDERIGDSRPTREEPGFEDTNPRGEALEDRVLELLDQREARSWEELVEALTAGLEERLDETLGELQESGRVRYSGRHGGYLRNE